MASKTAKPPINVILGGAGARYSAITGGFLELIKHFDVQRILCMSAGGIPAVFYCAGMPPERIKKVILGTDIRQLLIPGRGVENGSSLSPTEVAAGVYQQIQRGGLLTNIPLASFLGEQMQNCCGGISFGDLPPLSPQYAQFLGENDASKLMIRVRVQKNQQMPPRTALGRLWISFRHIQDFRRSEELGVDVGRLATFQTFDLPNDIKRMFDDRLSSSQVSVPNTAVAGMNLPGIFPPVPLSELLLEQDTRSKHYFVFDGAFSYDMLPPYNPFRLDDQTPDPLPVLAICMSDWINPGQKAEKDRRKYPYPVIRLPPFGANQRTIATQDLLTVRKQDIENLFDSGAEAVARALRAPQMVQYLNQQHDKVQATMPGVFPVLDSSRGAISL